MRRFLIAALLSLTASGVRGQRLDPAEYIAPVRNVAGHHAANFGEIRPGHFHAGVDIKTDGVEGKPLVAVADGYLSRVTLTAGGYGRAVYLTLRNGKTAVYGHLQRFSDDIERLVHEERLRRRKNRIDLSFEAGQRPVRQGELIGYSGNSGASAGPHLHFELRDTPTQTYHNLVREGILRPADNLPPRIVRLHYIVIDTLREVPLHGSPESYDVVRTAEGGYRLTRTEPLPAGRKGYFVLEATDRRNGVANTFGIWRVTVRIDGVPCFEYRMDGFNGKEASSSDAVSYYPLQRGSRNEVIRLAQAAGAPERFYPVARESGLVRTEPGETHRIRIEVEDDCGNSSQLEFDIAGRSDEVPDRPGTTASIPPRGERFPPQTDTAAVVLRHDRAGTLRIGNELTVRVPAGALCEPIFCRPERLETPPADSGLTVLSPAYRIFDARTPLLRPVTVSIRTGIPPSMQLRAVAAIRNADGELVCAGGTYADGALRVTTRSTGEISVVADTLPPVVQPLFPDGGDLTRTASLRFAVSDDFSGIADWELFVDGQWVPCDRFPMRGTLVHTLPAAAQRQRHEVLLRVTDGCGNTTRWEGTFYR